MSAKAKATLVREEEARIAQSSSRRSRFILCLPWEGGKVSKRDIYSSIFPSFFSNLKAARSTD